MKENDLKIMVKKNVISYREMGDLTVKVHEVTKSAFGRPDFDIEQTKEHLQGDVVMVAIAGDEVLGFSTLVFGSPSNVLGEKGFPKTYGCYFAGAAISDYAQGIGLYQTMNSLRLDIALENDFQLVYTRTQNALVETAITHSLKRIKEKGKIKNFVLKRIKMEGCYGQRLTGYVPPKSNDLNIQKAYNSLDLDKGDAYLLLFALKR